MKKHLSAHYCVHHLIFYGASAGIVSFATAFLLEKGLPATLVGTLLACSGLLSSVSQSVLAAAADRAKKNILPALIMVLSGLCMLCFVVLLLIPMPPLLIGLVYLMGVWSFDTIVPLMNSLSVYYNTRGHFVNYGLSLGLGSLAYAFSALIIGRIIADFGTDAMLLVILGLLTLFILLAFGYPKVAEPAPRQQKDVSESCSIGTFFLRYRWYCLSLSGILLLGMFHSMTENYLISIMGRLGGDSSHVGVALSVATISAAPVLALISRIRKKIPDTRLMIIAGLSFVLKSVLFLIAPSIPFIYAIQLLQMTSYALLSPVQVYYAGAKIAPADMVKGQAFIAASYTLGCGAGNMAGGFLVENLGVTAMLQAGIVIAVLGTAVLACTVNKSDRTAQA